MWLCWTELFEIELFLHLTVCIQKTILIFTNPTARAGYDTRSIFKRSLTGFNSEFSFSQTSCLTKVEEPRLPYYLPIAGGRIIGFIPFPRVLVLCEMQLVSARIWTRVTVSISYDGYHYTKGTSYTKSDTHTRLNCLKPLRCQTKQTTNPPHAKPKGLRQIEAGYQQLSESLYWDETVETGKRCRSHFFLIVSVWFI